MYLAHLLATVILPFRYRSRRHSLRGFTLVELMVVVVIIAILTVIAVPSIGKRLRERRSAEAAQRIASLYRMARLRAMGRGSAVLVRYDNATFQVLEAVVGGATCQNEPFSSCTLANFNAAGSFLEVTRFDPTSFEGVLTTATDATGSGSAAASLDVCYTPLGRAFTRVTPAAPFDPMTGVAAVTVLRAGGLARTVTVLPNGMSRVAL